jgi:hypothetical protein
MTGSVNTRSKSENLDVFGADEARMRLRVLVIMVLLSNHSIFLALLFILLRVDGV